MANQDKKITIAFDLYGTILSTSSISAKLSELLSIPSQKAEEIAELWRRYQLEYTWRSNSMQKYITFTEITLKSLHHALKEKKVPLPTQTSREEFEQAIMQSYNELHTFPDAAEALKHLASTQKSDSAPKIDAHIFSNGTPDMLSSSFRSPHLKSHSDVFASIVSVDSTRLFKPAPEVYHHLAKSVGTECKEMWLVSGNPFDAVGAKSAGMRTCWIDRGGNGWLDCLSGEEGKPDLIVKGVRDALGEIENWSKTH